MDVCILYILKYTQEIARTVHDLYATATAYEGVWAYETNVTLIIYSDTEA